MKETDISFSSGSYGNEIKQKRKIIFENKIKAKFLAILERNNNKYKSRDNCGNISLEPESIILFLERKKRKEM